MTHDESVVDIKKVLEDLDWEREQAKIDAIIRGDLADENKRLRALLVEARVEMFLAYRYRPLPDRVVEFNDRVRDEHIDDDEIRNAVTAALARGDV